MMEQISRRDWERLSAYLDGQLSPKEQARLKARLSTDAALQSGWDDLRRTREALRSMPRLRAPRNFTLRPEMVAQPKRKPSLWYPAFRLASVMVSLLFVLVVVGDLLGLGG
ncbi:MAG: zf-HC2 domain-containing protein, partial [Chloroflexota bacterium]|nr:zf-HC2 domain-containing protein [Chloroflexota bacterium]